MKENYFDKKHEILSKIYNLRVLSFNQINTYIFNESKRYCQKIVSELINDGLIEKHGYPLNNSHYFLTRKGLTFLKKNKIIMIGGGLWLDIDRLKTPSQLKIDTLNHQLELNDFILEFEKRYSDREIKYYSEFTMFYYFSDIIRPDSIIETSDTIYFLEMDMNTERKSRLIQKWENYRQYVTSSKFRDYKKDVKILFILGTKIQNSQAREDNLKRYIIENLQDVLQPKFNAYIDTQENLFKHIEKEELTRSNVKTSFQWKGFKVEKGKFTRQNISDYVFSFYIFKTDTKGNIASDMNTLMEFVVDDYRDGNLFTIKNIIEYPSFASSFKSLRKRDIKYLVIVKDIREALALCQITGVFSAGIYFVTSDDLKSSSPLTDILYTVGSDNNIYKVSKDDIRITTLVDIRKGL